MKLVALAILLSATALMASPIWAQTSSPSKPATPPAGQSSQPSDLVVAPNAAPTKADQQAPKAEATGREPANICKELVAFLQPKPAETPAPAQSGQASGQASNAPQTSGQTAPIAQEQKAAPSTIKLEEVKAYVDANDLRACQQAARKLRRAGLPMPAGLIALAALKPELLGSGQQ